MEVEFDPVPNIDTIMVHVYIIGRTASREEAVELGPDVHCGIK